MSSIIKEIEFSILTAPDEKRPHWVSLFKVPSANELLVRMKTDDGVEGFGLATSYTDITPLVNVVKGGLSDGGYRNKVPCYVTCAYYRDGKDNAELRDEIQMLVEQGHKGFKGKVGGLSLKEDIARMEIVREIIGPDNDLMIDVNRAWDLKTAIEGARLLEPLEPVWLEEPVSWIDDRRELKLLAQQTNIPLSGGESEITSYGCRAMIEEQAIQILQFDCTMFGGFTEGRKLAALCELNHIDVAPHHDCFIHAPLVAGTPAGRIVESFTDPERDPLQAELYENPPHIADGWLTLNEEPGLGLTLSESAITKFATRVL
jgi:D-galactarolactone cycloisomerase